MLKLNKVMRDGRYKKEIFQELTGKTVEELDQEWRGTLRKGETSNAGGDPKKTD